MIVENDRSTVRSPGRDRRTTSRVRPRSTR